MFVRTRAGSRPHPGQRSATASASRLARAWSSGSRSTISVSATSPGAARTPAWRMPPPSRLRARRPSAITSASPASSEPTGAHRPFDRQHMTVVAAAAHSAAGTPVAASALNRRAPSMWTRHRAGRIDHRAQARRRPRSTRRRHVRVLDADERHVGLVVRRRVTRPSDVVGAQHAVVVVELDELDPGVHRGGAVLVGDHVLAPARHHGGPGPGQDPDGDLVGHDPRGHEQRGRLADPLPRRPPRACAPSDPRRSRRLPPRPRPWRGASRASAG